MRIGSIAVVAICAGCGGVNSGEDSAPTPSPTPTPIYSLSSGEYDFDGEEVTDDDCWQDAGVHSILTAFALPVLIATNGETSFTVVGTGITEGILPPLAGTKAGNALGGEGSVTSVITSACSVRFDGNLVGVMTTNDEFDATLAVDLVVVGISNEAGTADSDCSALAGQDFPGTVIPVPDPVSTNQRCSITITGHVAPTPQ